MTAVITALAALLHAIAWPAVVLLVLYRHRSRFDDLLGRLREIGGGTKFDPPASQQPPSGPGTGVLLLGEVSAGAEQVSRAVENAPGDLTTAPEPLPEELAQFANLVVEETEQFLLTNPTILALKEPTRVRALARIAATSFVFARCERVEVDIWNSQLALLETLNVLAPASLAVADVRAKFYEPAAANATARYGLHPFEAWLEFLRSHGLVTDTADGRLAISVFGREYLVYRAKSGRGPKLLD
jgi:hypothetical protein